MSQIIDLHGEESFYHGESIYSIPKEASLLLPLESYVDVYYPSKRARVSVPYVSSGVSFEQKKQISLDVLPDECLYEILRRLPGDQDRSVCACVSKRWLMLLSSIPKEENCKNGEMKPHVEDQEVENDGFLTRNLEGKKATDVRLASVAVGSSGHGGLGKLMIRGTNSTRGVTNFGLKAIARCCPSLKALSLWNVPSIGDEGLIEIANRCPRLEKLDICQCPLVSDKVLLAFAKNCPNLTTISLDSCQNVGNEGLQAMGQFCRNLKSVAIKDCPLVADQGITGLVSSATFVLSKLKLQGLNVSDMSLAVIGHYGKVITELVFANMQNVNEKGFWVMANAQGLQHLKSLTISFCQGVTDVAVEALGKCCPNLKQFSLKKCILLSDNGLVSFAKAARSLQSLQLEECHRITPIGFFGLLLYCGSTLKALSMSSCFGFKDMILGLPLPNMSTSLQSLTVRNCPGLGDMTLAMLANLCPHLQHVELSGLPWISDTGLLSLVNSCEVGEGLAKVNLSGCMNVTDNVVVALAKIHGGTLEELNLDGCGKVTDASLVAVADDCLLLNELHVSKCAITDFGIASLARARQLSLHILSLAGCSMLSDKCLPFMIKLGQSLVGLNLKHCNTISSTVVDMLTERLFRCDILA